MSNGKTDFDIAELKSVLEDAYAIGKINRIESIACDEEELLGRGALASGAASGEETDYRSSFRVYTDTRVYFLKRVSDWMGETRLADVEDFIRWTSGQNGSLSPYLHHTRTGVAHITTGSKRYQLFNYIDQERRNIWMRPEMTPDDCALSGMLLGRMHLNSLGYLEAMAADSSTIFQDSPAITAHGSDVPLRATWDSLYDHVYSKWTHPHAILNQVRHSNNPIRSGFGMTAHEVSFDNKKRLLMLVHGDFHPGNVLFSTNEYRQKVKSVVDFDHMCWEHPFYDLGYALIMFARKLDPTQRNPTASGIAMQRIDWQLVEAFIEGYLTILSAIPDNWRLSQTFKSQMMASDGQLLSSYMKLGCYLIMAWAAEKVTEGPAVFTEIYLGVFELAYQLLCDDAFHYAGKIWTTAMTAHRV